MWRHENRPIVIEWRPRDRDLTATMKRDLLLFVESHGAADLLRTADASSGNGSPSDGLHWSCVELSGPSHFHQVVISIGRLGKRMEEVHDRGTIEPRLRCDRAAIVTPSWQNHLHDLQKAFNGGSRSRSTHDRGSIAARSWPDRGAIVALLKQNFGLIPFQSRSHDIAPRNRSHDPCKSLPRPLQLPTILG